MSLFGELPSGAKDPVPCSVQSWTCRQTRQCEHVSAGLKVSPLCLKTIRWPARASYAGYEEISRPMTANLWDFSGRGRTIGDHGALSSNYGVR
jgi:hypothetical protein